MLLTSAVGEGVSEEETHRVHPGSYFTAQKSEAEVFKGGETVGRFLMFSRNNENILDPYCSPTENRGDSYLS